MDSENDERPRGGRDDRDDEGEPPARSSTRPVWLILGAVGCGIVLLCSGLIAVFVVWGARSFTTDIPAAQGVADQFLDRLQSGKIDDAYALTGTQFRAGQSREQFEAFVKKFETFTRHTSRTKNGVRLFQDGSGKRVFIQMTLNAPNNAMTCTLVLIEEAGGWKVDKITVP